MSIELAEKIYDIVGLHRDRTIGWQNNIPGAFDLAVQKHRARGIQKVLEAMAAKDAEITALKFALNNLTKYNESKPENSN